MPFYCTCVAGATFSATIGSARPLCCHLLQHFLFCLLLLTQLTLGSVILCMTSKEMEFMKKTRLGVMPAAKTK